MAKVSAMPPPEKRRETGREGEAPPASLWAFGGLTPLQLGKRVWKEFSDDNVTGHAAQLSYYFLMALFPLLMLLLTIAGIVAQGNPHFRDQLFMMLGRVLPQSASDLIGKTVGEVTQAAGGLKLTFGIVFTLWSASGGVTAIMDTLNECYNVREGRPWWKRYGIAIGLTIAIIVLMLAAMALVLGGPHIAQWLGTHLHLGDVFVLAWRVLQYPVALALMVFTFALIYYFAPDVETPKWYWITPGSVVGVFLWVVASIAFRIYLHYFNSYAKTYGSLGAVIILMVWLYVTGIAILLGGEVNSEIEHAAAEKGRADAKLKGEKEAPAA